MQGNTREQRRPARPLLLGAVAAMLVLAPTAGAHNAQESDEHGTPTLEFEQVDDACEVRVVARHVDADEATLFVRRPPGGPHDPPVVHEERLNGTPEPEGDGFRFEAGPIPFDEDQFYWFELAWEEHSLRVDWNHFSECAPTPLLRVHEDAEGGAVTQVDGCSFFVEGRHLRHEEGTIRVSGLYRDDVDETPVTADDTEPDGEVGHRLFVGPLEVEESGRYSVRFWSPEGDSHAGLFVDFVGCSDEPPECPADLRVDVDENTNAVFWDAVQDALRYRLLRAEGDGEMVVVTEEDHPASVYVDHDVRPGVTYTYQVVAVGEVGESEGCETVQVTRPGGPEPEPEPEVCPPLALTATANADGSVLVAATGLDGEAVLVRSDGGEAIEVATLDAEGTFLDAGTQVGTTYTYTLLVDGEACASVEVTAIPVFPSLLAGALAVAASLLGFVAVRRR